MHRHGWLRWAHLALLVTIVSIASRAEAHWCNDLWISQSNIVVRPATDTVTVPTSGNVTLDVFVQNNTGYPLETFVLSATASGYTVSVARATAVRGTFLLPTESAKFTVTISKSGGGTLDVSGIDFHVKFGGPQYDGDGIVTLCKNDGTVSDNPAPTPSGDGQAYNLIYMGAIDFGDATNQSSGLDKLLQYYCVGRGSWAGGSGVDTSKCPLSGSWTCSDPSGLGTGNGSKYDYAKLWSANELVVRKSVLGGRAAQLRTGLECGARDQNLGFAGIAMMSLGYLGEDAGARTFLQSQITAGGDRGTIAKAAIVLMGNAADMTTHQSALQTGLSSGNIFVSAACAAALGIVNRDDNVVSSGLIQKVAWNEPDTGDNGKGFYPSNLLSIVAWDRRGWATACDDSGAISFYGGTPVTPGEPVAPGGIACKGNGTSIQVTWNPVTRDVKGNGTTITGYKVYSGATARPGAATKPGTGGFDYGHVDDATGTSKDVTAGLSATGSNYFAVTAINATGASVYSAEVSCTMTSTGGAGGSTGAGGTTGAGGGSTGAGGGSTGAGGTAGGRADAAAGGSRTGGAGGIRSDAAAPGTAGAEEVTTDTEATGSCGCSVIGRSAGIGFAALLLAAALGALRRRNTKRDQYT